MARALTVRAAALVIAVVTAGCGRIAFEPLVPDDSGASAVDAPPGAFGPAILIAELSVAITDDPTLSQDELEIVFGSTRPGGMGSCDLYTSTRSSIGAAWAPPNNIAALNTTLCDASPMFFDNDLGLRFAYASGSLDLTESRRPARGGAWQPPQPVQGTNTGAGEFAPTATVDDLLMIFATFGGLNDLIMVTRTDTSQPWSGRAPVTELNVGIERSPHLSGDGLTLWFISDRPGGGGGGQDIWVASRASRTAPFEAPVPLTELNTADDEDDPWVSPDQRRIYFARYPLGSTSSSQLFFAER